MAKNKKGYQELKRYRMTSGNTDEFIINLKKYADEFTKLLKKRYYFILSNGQKISLKFEEGNFYHLLGFHKFTKTVFAQMISQDTYSYNATDFYKDVLNENIKFDWWDENKVTVPQNLLNAGYYRNFIDQKDDSEVRDVINRRFPYFTYDNLIKIFSSKVVIDYNIEESESDVQADKIFFIFLSETGRNLNLGTDGDINGYFPTTFFLENKKNWFKYKKDGTLSDILDILGVYIEDTDYRNTILFKMNWGCIRKKVLNENDIGFYSEMKKIFNKENITSFYMEQQVSELRTRISQQTEEIDKIKDKIKIWNFKIRYLDNEHDQEAVLGLMDFGIDVEQEKLNKAEIIKASKQLHKELSAKSDLNKKHEKKVKKIQNAMSSIQQLDILMVQSVYIHFIKNSIFWSEAFWEYFVANFNWIESNIEPAVFKKIYKDWRLLGNK